MIFPLLVSVKSNISKYSSVIEQNVDYENHQNSLS